MTKAEKIDSIMSSIYAYEKRYLKSGDTKELVLMSFYTGKLMETDRDIGRIYVKRLNDYLKNI